MLLVQIDSGYFCAGAEFEADRLVRCAPILRKALSGKTLADVLDMCKRRRWQYQFVAIPQSDTEYVH